MEFDKQSLSAEILAYVNQVFANCKISSQYYPTQKAWKFMLSFTVNPSGSFLINPPCGFCLMKVHAIGREITFKMVLFVDDFSKYHLQTIAN